MVVVVVVVVVVFVGEQTGTLYSRVNNPALWDFCVSMIDVPTSKDQKQRRVSNPTLWDFCVSMIGCADIEGSKATSHEQSDTLGLLRLNDRKCRHRRIKSNVA
jgi:hypothetical protein